VTLLLVGVIVNALIGSVFLLLYNVGEHAAQFRRGAVADRRRDPDLAHESAETRGCGCRGGWEWIVLLSMGGQLNASSSPTPRRRRWGVRIQRLRWIALIVASLITAAAVAVSGRSDSSA
jgi:ABC-type Fe3+-siderophore transport system permease subunit